MFISKDLYIYKQIQSLNITQEIEDFPIEVHGVKSTGGLKSALIIYLLAKEIQVNQYKQSIRPLISVIEGKGYQELKTEQVVDWIRQQFPDVEFLEPMRTICANDYDIETDQWTKRKAEVDPVLDLSRKAFFPKGHERTPQGFQHRLVDTVWTGESARASVEDVAVFLANVDETYHLEDRGFDDEPVQDGRFFNPFINLTTLDIIKLYKEHGLEETLLPLTYSCDEWSNDYTKPCGVCSNCLEREWAITSVFPPEPHTTLESALANYNMG